MRRARRLITDDQNEYELGVHSVNVEYYFKMTGEVSTEINFILPSKIWTCIWEVSFVRQGYLTLTDPIPSKDRRESTSTTSPGLSLSRHSTVVSCEDRRFPYWRNQDFSLEIPWSVEDDVCKISYYSFSIPDPLPSSNLWELGRTLD